MRRITSDVAVHVDAAHGEGPVWLDDEDRLLWVDIPRSQVHRTDVESGEDDVIEVGQHVGAAVPRTGGGLALALADGFALREADGAIEFVAPVTQDDPDVRFNDGKCDPVGRFLAGTMAYDARPGAGSLFRLDPDRTVTRLLDGVTVSNGLAWSGDGGTFYYIDTRTSRIDAFDYDLGNGNIANGRTIAAIPADDGHPDGMAIDTEGCLWVALFGGGAVHRYTPDGRLDALVNLPVTQVTSCSFGGPHLDRLYMTTSTAGLERPDEQPLAGAVFVCAPGVSGPPASRYAG